MTRRLLSLPVPYACFLHVVWALLLLFWPVAANATPLHGVLLLPLPRLAIVGLMLIASALAFHVVFLEPHPGRYAGLMLAPQALIVALAAFGAASAIWSGHYADGVIRHRAFIAADQLHPLLLFLFHQVAFGAYLGPLSARIRNWKE